jgi:2-haloacid dehalogenase
MILDDLVEPFGIDGLSGEEMDHLNRVWHRLDPWPDAVEGLERLGRRYIVATLSNGNVALLVNMARYAGLRWDCILSAELVRRYKPDPVVYQSAADLLGLPPDRVMMVAAHEGDLRAASGVGFRTALVPRPKEHGGVEGGGASPDPGFDVVAADFVELADVLGA